MELKASSWGRKANIKEPHFRLILNGIESLQKYEKGGKAEGLKLILNGIERIIQMLYINLPGSKVNPQWNWKLLYGGAIGGGLALVNPQWNWK